MFYFAYGSNTPEQMVFRAPKARFLGIATLKGWKLTSCYYFTVGKKKREKVKGFLYEIDEESESELDTYEGYPKLYRKEYLTIRFKGKRMRCLVYVMNEEYSALDYPSAEYYYVVGCAYERYKVPMRQLKKAIKEVSRSMWYV